MAVAGWLVLGAASGAHGAAPSPVCPDLASLPLAGARIDSAQAVAKGDPLVLWAGGTPTPSPKPVLSRQGDGYTGARFQHRF